MRLRYSRPAARELQHAIDYLAERSPQAAARVLQRIRDIERHVGIYPKAGLRTADPNLRAILVVPFPYVILYEECGDEILVHRFRHTAQRPAW